MTVFEQMWQGINQSNTRNTAIVRKRNQENRPGCFVIKKHVISSYWPIYLLRLPPRPPWCCDVKIHRHGYVPASTVSLRYRTCRHISVSTVKRHQTTSGITELLASWRIQAMHTTGTEVFKLSEAQWTSLYHTGISFILRQAIKYDFLKNP